MFRLIIHNGLIKINSHVFIGRTSKKMGFQMTKPNTLSSTFSASVRVGIATSIKGRTLSNNRSIYLAVFTLDLIAIFMSKKQHIVAQQYLSGS